MTREQRISFALFLLGLLLLIAFLIQTGGRGSCEGPCWEPSEVDLFVVRRPSPPAWVRGKR